MVITVFGDTVVKPGKEKAEDNLVEKLDPILRAMPGFISIKAYRGEDGEEIGIIRFDSRQSLEAWMQESLHPRLRMSPTRFTSASGSRPRRRTASTRG